MADQLTELVKRMQAEGVPEADIVSFVHQFDTPAVSHGVDADTTRAAQKATGIESDSGTLVAPGGGRGTRLDVRKSDKWLRDEAPTIGATIATLPMGGEGGFMAAALRAGAAGAGGAVGSGLRGDDAGAMMNEATKQALLQGGGEAVVNGGRMVAHGLMRGTVPKNIAKDFADVDIAGTMLDRGVVPGSASSARRVEGLSQRANIERDAAASTVPTMPRTKIIEGLRPMHAKGVKGKVPEMSDATLEQMRKSAREIGPSGLEGEQALARKDIKQAQGNAALNSSDPRTAAFGSQLADAERSAIVSHLRETPRMSDALDESQAMMAVDQVMKDAKHSNPVTRARIGGLPAAALSPIGLSTTAHAVNQTRKIANPQLLRLLDMIMGSQQ